MRALTLPLVLLSLGACAPTTPAEPGQTSLRAERRCFQQVQISNFRADRQTVYLRVGHNAVYQADTAGACQDLDTSFQLAVAPLMGASSLCTGDMVALVTPGNARPTEVCRARLSAQLTEEQVAALPSRLQP